MESDDCDPIFEGVLVKNLCSKLKLFNLKSQKTLNFSLKDISFNIKRGELLAIIGPVGSGKVS